MLEAISIALITHLGKKVIDRFWNRLQTGNTPVVNQTGNIENTTLHAGRTLVQKEFTVPEYQEYELILGNFFMTPMLMALLVDTEVPLVLIIEETQQQVFLFEADLDEGYEIDLAHGIYSFYVFLVDRGETDLLNSAIHAVGLPSRIDLSGVEDSLVEDEDVWNLVEDSPIEITRGGPYNLDFVLIDVDELPEFPKVFSQLWGEVAKTEVSRQYYDLTGVWKLQEVYEFGSTTAEAYLAQVGTKLSGLIIIHDILEDGQETIIQEAVSGAIEGTHFTLYGTKVRIIKGKDPFYELDRWTGIIKNNNRILGFSQDEAGTTGEFVMERVMDR